MSSAILNISCQLPTNADGTPILTSGILIPDIFFNGFGYVALNTTVAAPIVVPFVVTSIENDWGFNNGGY